MRRLAVLILPLVAAACGGGSDIAPDVPTRPVADGPVTNAGFESGGLAPWDARVHANPEAFHIGSTSEHVVSGRYAVLIQGDGSEPWGGVAQLLRRPGLGGKRVALSASVRGENVQGGVQMWAAFRGSHSMPFEQTLDGTDGSFGWRRVGVEFDVPEKARDVEIGIMLVGSGRIWLDDVSLTER